MAQESIENTVAQSRGDVISLHVKLPPELHAEIERHLAGTRITKQTWVLKALRAYLESE